MDRSSIIGMESRSRALVELGQLKLFARATGQTQDIYRDEEAAQRAGFRSIVAPPTFAVCLSPHIDLISDALQRLGISSDRGVHGDQTIEPRKLIQAGDVLTFVVKIEQAYDKKNGELMIIEYSSTAFDPDGDVVVVLRSKAIAILRGAK
jgi:acyl dehydratase